MDFCKLLHYFCVACSKFSVWHIDEDAPEVVGNHSNIFLHIDLRICSCSLEENDMFLFLFILQTHTVEGLWISCIMSKLTSFDILALCRKC